MKRSRFSEEQIVMALRQAEAGTPVAEICRKLQVTEQTFYRWKRKYGQLGTPEIRELRQLRDENKKLKALVADLTLDKHILQESLKKSTEAGAAAPVGNVGTGCLPDLDPPCVPGKRVCQIERDVQVPPSPSGRPQAPDQGAGCSSHQLRISQAACASQA